MENMKEKERKIKKKKKKTQKEKIIAEKNPLGFFI